MIDFDHNATTPLDPVVSELMVQMMRRDDLGNPSSVHGRGRASRDVVERARAEVASAVGAQPLEVTLTAGGTEANSLAVLGTVRARRRAGLPCGILTSKLEHPAVTTAATAVERDGVRVVWIPADDAGRIDPQAVGAAVASTPEIGLVSLMAANHELGNRYDIRAFVQAIRSTRHDVIVHTDAVQALGKTTVDFKGWGVDMLTVSAHKIGGPTGAGALVHGRSCKLEPVSHGHQERGRRGGTEATIALAGFGAAAHRAAAAVRSSYEHCNRLRQSLLDGLLRLGGHVAGDPACHIGNTVNVGFWGCDGELMCMNLDLEGFAVSTGAACSAGALQASPVLLAICADPDRARQSVRLSLGPRNTQADVRALLDVLPSIIERVRAASDPLGAGR